MFTLINLQYANKLNYIVLGNSTTFDAISISAENYRKHKFKQIWEDTEVKRTNTFLTTQEI